MKKGVITVLITWQAGFFLLLFSHCTSTNDSINNTRKIVVKATISKYFYRDLNDIFDVKDEVNLRYHSFPATQIESSLTYIPGKVNDGLVKWVIDADGPVRILPPFGNSIIAYPGDSIHIQYQRDYPTYYGKNRPALQLLDTLMFLNERLIKPRRKHGYNVDTLPEFLEWNQFLDDKLTMELPAIESYKDKLLPAEYEYYKAELIGHIESERLDAFTALYRKVYHGRSNLNRTDLIQIWDSTQNKPSRQWLHSISGYAGSIYDIYAFVFMEIYREAGFDTTNVYYKNKEVYTSTLYHKAKNNYKGKLRERLMAHILDEPTITEMGLKNPTTQALLKDYYSQPGYPEYKAYVKGLEKKRQQREIEKKKEKEKKYKDNQEG